MKYLYSVTSLDLSVNELYKLSADDLAKVIMALPLRVTSLDLRGNNLNQFSANDLAKLLAALPLGVISLDLRNNHFDFKTPDDLAKFLKSIPLSVQSVIINDTTTININEFWSHKLLNQINTLVLKKEIQGLDYISPPIEIDEVLLPRFIRVLEQQNTPAALLTCGLLLEGKIETTCEEHYGPKEYTKYMEKRTHDAISFYSLAAQDLELKPLIDFILWELKTTVSLPSVHLRLASYDTSPPKDIIKSYSQFRNKESGVSLPFSNDARFFSNPGKITDSEIKLVAGPNI